MIQGPRFSVVIVLVLLAVGATAGYRRHEAQHSREPGKSSEYQSERGRRDRPPNIVSPAYDRMASIQALDFKNLRYPGVKGMDFDLPTAAFQLKRGEFGSWRDGMKLRNVSFGDVTGDGKDEAIVSFDVLTDGNQGRDAVYLFTVVRNRPKVIYVFESGDRAEGGLRQAYADRGRFVLELWGPGNTLEEYDATDGSGLCCPKTFTRSSYQWRNGAFEQKSCEILSNPQASAQCPTCYP